MPSEPVLAIKNKSLKLSSGFRKILSRLTPYFFIAPFIISFALFFAFPVILTFILSFYHWHGITMAMEYVGFNNYMSLLNDQYFWRALNNTLSILFMTTLPVHAAAICLAYLLNSAFVKMKGLFKSVLILPYITSSVAIALIFWFLTDKNGPLTPITNYLFFLIGGSRNNAWFYPVLVLPPILFWKLTGWNIILYLAGLQAIPNSLYEAALVDGADWKQIFFHITLPLLKPMIYFAITMSTISLMQLFDEPMVLFNDSGHAPFVDLNVSSTTLVMYTYALSFRYGSFGIGSALSYMLVVLILGITGIIRMFLVEDKNERRKSKNEE